MKTTSFWMAANNLFRKLDPILVTLGLATFVQALATNYYFIGYFIDDSVYILLARSFVQGSAASLPAATASFRDVLPGFPILLAPFVGLFGPTSLVLRLVPFTSLLLAGIVLARLTRISHPGFWGILTLVLFSFNVDVVRSAGAIMAEPSFLAGCLLLCYFMSKEHYDQSWILSTALLAFVPLIRPEGIIFIAAAWLGVLNRRNYKKVMSSFLLVAILFGGLLMIQYLQTGHVVQYFETLFNRQGHAFTLGSYGRSLKGFIGFLVPGNFFHFPIVLDLGVRRWIAWTSIIWVWGLMIVGARYHWEETFTRISFLYVLLTTLAMPLWVALDDRYALILLPFMVPVFVHGLRTLYEHSNSGRALTYLFIGVWVIFQVQNVGYVIRGSLHPSPMFSVPRRTFQYIRDRLDPASVMIGEYASTVYLYTGHPCERYLVETNPDKFWKQLEQQGVLYGIIRNAPMVVFDPSSFFYGVEERTRRWIRTSSNSERIFSEPSELIEIYKFHWKSPRKPAE